MWSFAQQQKVDKVTTLPHLVWSGCDNKQNPIQPMTTADAYYYNNIVKKTEDNKIKIQKIDRKTSTNEGVVNKKLWSLIADYFLKSVNRLLFLIAQSIKLIRAFYLCNRIKAQKKYYYRVQYFSYCTLSFN